MPQQQAKIGKSLPKRCGRENWKARFRRYISNDTRAKNKAKRIVKAALRSYNPRKVALAQADKSPRQSESSGVSLYVRKILDRKGL